MRIIIAVVIIIPIIILLLIIIKAKIETDNEKIINYQKYKTTPKESITTDDYSHQVICFTIKGLQFRSKKAIVVANRLSLGTQLELHPDKKNIEDKNAMKVYFANVHLGYVERSKAELVREQFENNNIEFCLVKRCIPDFMAEEEYDLCDEYHRCTTQVDCIIKTCTPI